MTTHAVTPNPMTPSVIDLDDIRAAAQRIATHVVHTPCCPSGKLSELAGCSLFLKAESLQHTGAFKARGATNAVLSLSDEEASRGVVTHSSGNHAAALARAASLRGIPAHVVMPKNSAAVKIANVRSFGTEPIFCDPTAESRDAVAAKVMAETGGHLVHPYNDPRVMAGQGTVGLEILEQVNEVDDVVVPVGGGGLLSGVLTAIKSLRPDVRIFAAEPAQADDAYRSLRSGNIEQPTRYDTIADGLRSPLGTNTFPIIRASVEDVLLVADSDILNAMRAIHDDAKLVVEPSGAVAVGAVLTHQDLFSDRKVVAVLTGGNLDPSPR